MVRCASTQKFGTKETAHALVGGRVGTAVVLLVDMQSGFPARGVFREHGRPLGVARGALAQVYFFNFLYSFFD